SSPLKTMLPPVISPTRSGSRPRMESASVVLPAPVSPTRPSFSPRAASRSRPLSAQTYSSPRLYLTRRSFTSSSFFPAVSMRATSASGARVVGVPQPVADEVHVHDRQADADARRKAQIGIVADVQ